MQWHLGWRRRHPRSMVDPQSRDPRGVVRPRSTGSRSPLVRRAGGALVAALLALSACVPPSGQAPAAPASQAPAKASSQPAASADAKAPATDADPLASLNGLSGQERQARLLEGAKKEQTVVWYSTYALAEAEPYIESFNKVYPDIKVEYFRAGSQQLLDKLLSEYRAGRHQVDVIAIDHEAFEDLKEVGAVGRYCSPERQAAAEQFKDKECEWTTVYHNPKVIGYNTEKVPADQAPKTWNDLLDPRWQGRIGIPANDGPEWIVTMENMLGKEKGQEYVKKMAEQNIQLHQSNSGLAQLIAAGDVDLGFQINVPAITNTQKQGGPIASVSPDPLPTTLNSVMLAREPQHPFAAALLIDYILSKQGQQRMAEISTRFGPRTDMTYPEQQLLADARLFVVTPEMVRGEAYKQASQQFKELFGQR